MVVLNKYSNLLYASLIIGMYVAQRKLFVRCRKHQGATTSVLVCELEDSMGVSPSSADGIGQGGVPWVGLCRIL